MLAPFVSENVKPRHKFLPLDSFSDIICDLVDRILRGCWLQMALTPGSGRPQDQEYENLMQFYLLFCFVTLRYYLSVIPFEFSPSSQFFPCPFGIEMALLKNAVSIEESQRDVKKVHFLRAILVRQELHKIRSNQ